MHTPQKILILAHNEQTRPEGVSSFLKCLDSNYSEASLYNEDYESLYVILEDISAANHLPRNNRPYFAGSCCCTGLNKMVQDIN